MASKARKLSSAVEERERGTPVDVGQDDANEGTWSFSKCKIKGNGI